ncbi:CaiB/BaiF CoA transferase family protein [Arthrobacter sp. NPDC093139]|uniref:CaiB/BaiF CoA transferase family protein n=1 Tax=Arthrobacter sp. NPDC093139 TaxID=3363945 RepID=UPI0037F30FCB
MSGALDGLRVIEAASLVAGPMIGTYFAEYGADVIKVEDPTRGDEIRYWGAKKDDHSLMAKTLGRNKRFASLNLREAEGQRLFRELCKDADVVIQNTRPETLKRWGLSYEDLKAVNDQIVVVHVTGFGAGGPKSNDPGFGTLGEAMSGFAQLTGEQDSPPQLPRFMLADYVAATHGAFAAMMGLRHRDRTGKGQLIDLSLVEPLSRYIEMSTLIFDQLGVNSVRNGNQWEHSVPRNVYRSADHRWVAVSASAQSIAHRVFDAIGRPDLKTNPDFADPANRIRNRNQVDALVQEWASQRSLDEIMNSFEHHQVAAAPVYDAETLLSDEHFSQRAMFVSIQDPDLGAVKVQAPVARMSESPGSVKFLGKSIGADNEAVFLEELLQSDMAEYLRLKSQNII